MNFYKTFKDIILNDGAVTGRAVKLCKSKQNILPCDVKSVYVHNNNVTVVLYDGRKGTSVCSSEDNFGPYVRFCIA